MLIALKIEWQVGSHDRNRNRQPDLCGSVHRRRRIHPLVVLKVIRPQEAGPATRALLMSWGESCTLSGARWE
jgi:hypothetical protein